MKQKKIIIVSLCVAVCIMAIGFAAFSTTLSINGTSSIESNWSVVFTNIQELSKTSGVTINNAPSASGTTATFDVSLDSPGDSIEYQITVANQGTLDAIIESINASETGSEAIIGYNGFNSSLDDNTYVGYMYGTPGSSTYEETHANINDSTIKGVLDIWYKENLLDNYATYLADAGFCGDRSLSSGTGIGTTATYYGAYNRLYNNKTPQFACPQSNDLYTTSSSNKGNKALDYPIGLITADEAAYAGGVYNVSNTSYYLNTGSSYWTMCPRHFVGSGAVEWRVGANGYLLGDYVDGSHGARPVINLKSGIEITGGDGTSSNPYVIKTN